MVRALPRIGLACALAAPVGCGDLGDETRAPESAREQPSRAQIYNRDRTFVAGMATSLALGIVGLGTLLATGIFAAPGGSEPQTVPRTITIAGGVMSTGFVFAVPFALAAERHRARYPAYFPGGRGRSRDLSPKPFNSTSPGPTPQPTRLSLHPRQH